MSRRVAVDYEALREAQARVQECLVADLERADDFERNDHG